jgi:hypothetical protein
MIKRLAINSGLIVGVLVGWAQAQWINQAICVPATCLAGSGSYVFAGTGCGVYRSADNGQNFDLSNTGLNNYDVSCVAVTNRGSVLLGTTWKTSGNFFRSTNNGSSWSKSNTGLPTRNVTCLEVIGDKIYAGTYGGVYLSIDDGVNWTPIGLTNSFIESLMSRDSILYVGTYGNGVLRTANSGTTWDTIGASLVNENIKAMISINSMIFAATVTAGVFKASLDDTTWTPINSGLPSNYVGDIGTDGYNLFAGSWNWNNSTGGMYLSSNYGVSWTPIGLTDELINGIYLNATRLFACTNGTGVGLRSRADFTGMPGTGQVDAFSNVSSFIETNGGVQLRIKTGQTLKMSITAYYCSGQKAAGIFCGSLSRGEHTIQWDTRALSSGIYMVRLAAEGHTVVQRIVVSR